MSLNYTTPAPIGSISFSGLASKNATAAAGTAAKVTSTTNNVVDAQVVVTVVAPAFTPTSSTSVDIYAVGSLNGTTWPGAGSGAEVITSADAAITLSANSNNLRWLGCLMCHTSGGTFTSEPLNIAALFGGTLPASYKIVIQNNLPAGVSLTSGTVNVSEVYYN